MTEPVTTDSSTTAKSGVDVASFASRRTLVFRRFLRNKPAVVSLAVLLLMFIGCYVLPPLLPYNYSDLDYFALQQPPTIDHWSGFTGAPSSRSWSRSQPRSSTRTTAAMGLMGRR